MDKPASDPLVGQQVANFRIDKLVKDGTLSRIYHGRDVIQRRPVAVKIIDAHQAQDNVYLERFLREARGMMSAWWHQHITRIYYAAKRDGRYITVMEYVDGPNLREMVLEYAADRELLPVDDVVRIGRAISEALAYAHQHGVVHRDVKPSNVLMCVDGRILLTDFGLAPPVLLKDDAQIYGTPAYISPEQIASSRGLDVRADLYSLAVVMYELLVGQRPFSGEDNDAVLQQHLTVMPLAPSVVNPQLSRDVDAVLLKALSKSPDKRYQSGFEFIAALEEALGASMALLTEDDEMPPLPAVMQEDKVAVPAVSQTSVVDKIASQLEMPTGEFEAVKLEKRRRAIGCRPLMIGLFVLILVIVGVYVFQFFTGSEGMSTPTAVAVVPATVTTAPETAVPMPTIISATVIMVVTSLPPTSTDTPQPTVTPSLEPTETATLVPPTATSSPTQTPPFTGAPIHFHYSRYSFYMLNPASEPIQASSVSFQAVDIDGQSTGQSFRGRDWSAIYPDLETGRCNAIEIMDAPGWLRPPECQAYNVTITPLITYDAFWQEDAGIDSFRVFWNGRDIGTCPVVTGLCVLQLP